MLPIQFCTEQTNAFYSIEFFSYNTIEKYYKIKSFIIDFESDARNYGNQTEPNFLFYCQNILCIG